MGESKKDIVVYDGICVLCNSFLRWLLKNDVNDHFKFTTFESLYIQKKIPDIILLDSVIVITKDNLILKKGNAFLHILRKLKKLKLLVFILSLFPLKIIDFFYTIIAKTRYKIFGKYNSCPVVEKKYLKKIIK